MHPEDILHPEKSTEEIAPEAPVWAETGPVGRAYVTRVLDSEMFRLDSEILVDMNIGPSFYPEETVLHGRVGLSMTKVSLLASAKHHLLEASVEKVEVDQKAERYRVGIGKLVEDLGDDPAHAECVGRLSALLKAVG